MAQKIYYYPVWLRLWHMTNALMFLTLILTGLSMQYGLFRIRFDYAVSIHNISGIILAICYLIYFIANFLTGNLKYYRINFKGFFKRLLIQFRFYTFGIFKNEKAPYPVTLKRKFNPLQKFTYVGVMYIIVPLIIISGLAMLFPQVIYDRVLGIPGIVITDLVHVVAGFLGSIFMIIHVYFCTIGASPSANFKSIISGFHEIE
jgi:thiosulfate reductase cytochrome b subunit